MCFITKRASDLFYITENQVKEYKSIRLTKEPSQRRRWAHQLFCRETYWSPVSCGQLNVNCLNHEGEMPLLRGHSLFSLIRLGHQINSTSRLKCSLWDCLTVSSHICSLVSGGIVLLRYWILTALDSVFLKKSIDFMRIQPWQSVVQKHERRVTFCMLYKMPLSFGPVAFCYLVYVFVFWFDATCVHIAFACCSKRRKINIYLNWH